MLRISLEDKSPASLITSFIDEDRETTLDEIDLLTSAIPKSGLSLFVLPRHFAKVRLTLTRK
jgi:hypothetical protein